MTDADLTKLELLVRDANEAVAAGRKADSIRDELAFAVPKLIAELRALRMVAADAAIAIGWHTGFYRVSNQGPVSSEGLGARDHLVKVVESLAPGYTKAP